MPILYIFCVIKTSFVKIYNTNEYWFSYMLPYLQEYAAE